MNGSKRNVFKAGPSDSGGLKDHKVAGLLLIVSLIFLGLAFSPKLRTTTTQTFQSFAKKVIPNFSHGISEAQMEKVKKRFESSQKESVDQELRSAYLSAWSSDQHGNFLKLAAGLESSNEEIRQTAAVYVEGLLIDVAHGIVPIDPSSRKELFSLFSIYKNRAHDQVQKLQKASPQSRTLAFLNHLERELL